MGSPLSRLNLSRARILVIEDNPGAMEILSQILLGFGVSGTRKAVSAEEAMEPALREPFDLMLVDEEMPGESGLDFCRQVRGDPKAANCTTAMILFTALPSPAGVRRARDAGANFVLAKPIVPGVLLERIDWIARENRPFVACDSYRGPDRRFQNQPPPNGEERRAETLAMLAAPERSLAQSEIDSLFD